MNWTELFGPEPLPEYEPRPCTTPRCDLCGKFSKTVTLVYTGGAYPEPDYVACDRDSCKRK